MTNVPSKLGEALDYVHEQLRSAELFYGHGTDNAWDEAVLLVLSACNEPPDAPPSVLDQDVSDASREIIATWLSRRLEEHLPLPYLLGKAWFAGLEFRCDSRALVPRSPLAEVILDDYQPWKGEAAPQRVLDLCCGGGCIGVSAAVYRKDLQLVLADIDTQALALAKENAALHQVLDRVELCHSDLFADLRGQCFDIILSNPPYVNAQDLTEMPLEYQAEPVIALGSGDDGLEITWRILAEAEDHLNDGGLLFIELGNSWAALDTALASLPLTWLEFAQGGHGVLVLRKDELAAVRAVF